MNAIRFTLVSDGVTDDALLPILAWLLRRHLPHVEHNGEHADFRRLRRTPRRLEERIEIALDLYPCDLLFIHRDAEKQEPALRRREIEGALEAVKTAVPPAVCVIPVRMTEAWLLIDEQAIRRASGNPNGRVKLEMPRVLDLETLPDPKATIHELLVLASELTGRRRKHFDEKTATRRVVDFLDDFAELRRLPAFQTMEEDLLRALALAGFVVQE